MQVTLRLPLLHTRAPRPQGGCSLHVTSVSVQHCRVGCIASQLVPPSLSPYCLPPPPPPSVSSVPPTPDPSSPLLLQDSAVQSHNPPHRERSTGHAWLPKPELHSQSTSVPIQVPSPTWKEEGGAHFWGSPL